MHTPGPYKVTPIPVTHPDHGNFWIEPMNPTNAYDAATALATVYDEEQAALFAAAPDLLEALKAIKARYEGVFDHPALLKQGALNTNAATDMWAIANRAIAKAEGRS